MKKKNSKKIKTNEKLFTMSPQVVFQEFAVSPDELRSAYEEKRIKSQTITKKVKNKWGETKMVMEVYFDEKDLERIFKRANKDMTLKDLINTAKRDLKLEDKVFEYKGYKTSPEFDDKDSILVGQIKDINDLVSFEGKSIGEFKAAFEEAVDNYIQTVNELDKGLGNVEEE
jgi:hypothetical protein